MDPPERNKNLPAAETQEVAEMQKVTKTQKAWPLQHYWEGEITTGYTNSEKLRKLHKRFFPEFYKNENKREDDHEWDPIEIKGERMLYLYQRRDGAARDLKKEFPEFEWPEKDVWGSYRCNCFSGRTALDMCAKLLFSAQEDEGSVPSFQRRTSRCSIESEGRK